MTTNEKFIRLADKIDRMTSHLGSIDSTLAAQHVSLKEHMRRTEILESKIEPLEKQTAMVHGALKLIGAGTALFGIIEGLLALKNLVS